ncbi:MAG: biopolymer transporter Tol [Verrucomicrobiota bacterium]|nr:PD40 domain-containing protein [Chthoniobacterales bacterium]MDQ3415199.1 biopolymer transporter Tol [Verrucomicrobiota bacterium]
MTRREISNWISGGLFFCLTIATSSAAEDVPTITVSKGDQINLSVTPLTGAEGAAATKTVQNDLALSGYFKFGGADSSYIVRGSASGGSLGGQVTDHSGGTVLSKTYSNSTRENAHQFANDIIETLTGHKGLAGTKITFIATRSGKKEVYLADFDGSNVRQLTRDGTISVHPSLSPDGRRLAYTGYQSGYADVYVIDVASGARNRIVNFPGTNSGATFSPNGGELALTISKDGNPELYTVSASGGGARRLTRTRGVESGPTWSPDGSEIIYSSDQGGSPQLYRISSSGGRGRQIATGRGYCTEPNWSPDGKKVAFNVRSGGEFQIAVLDLAGGATRTLATGQDPAWGADSRHVIFTDGGALYMLDTVSSRKNKIVDGLGKITEPSWSR